MVCGKVTGTIVSTRKVETLVGSKFLEVELYRNGAPTGEFLVAIDRVGAVRPLGSTTLSQLTAAAARAWRSTTARPRPTR